VAAQPPNNRLKKAAGIAAFFFSPVLFAACPPPETQSPPMRVEHVTDGDTLRLENGQRVRIVGINTMELRDTGWAGVQARRAKDAASEFLPQVVRLSPWPAPTDRYGRVLANIWHDGTYLAEYLLGEGLGFAVAVPPNTRLARCLKAAEDSARDHQMGLWSRDVFPQSIRDLDADLGGFQLLRGQVTAIEKQKRTQVAILDTGLRLEISSGIDVPAVGDWIVVRGWVTRSPKAHRARLPWTLRIRHPANLDLSSAP
jgi:endonuclease YncB( thermonuclease family)